MFIIKTKSLLLALLIVLVLLPTSCSKTEQLSATELLDLGERYLLELDYEQAVVAFTGLIKIEPKNPRGYTGAAEAYMGLEQPLESISIVRSGIKTIINPVENQPLFVWLEDFGDAMFAEENFSVSAQAYEVLLEENPQVEYVYKLAQVYIASGQIEKAIELLETMAELLGNEDLLSEAGQLKSLTNDNQAAGLIQIVDVTPKSAPVGQETTYSVTVCYATANDDDYTIYAGANTRNYLNSNDVYLFYDEYVLADNYGIFTFQFKCVPSEWPDEAFSIRVEIWSGWKALDWDTYTF